MPDFCRIAAIGVSLVRTNFLRSSRGSLLAGESTAIIRVQPISAANFAFSSSCASPVW